MSTLLHDWAQPLVGEGSGDPIWTIDRDGRFGFLNAAAARVLGYSPEELLGRRFSELRPPQETAGDAELFARLLGGEALAGYEVRQARRDGTMLTLALTALPLRGADGQVAGVLVAARDLTGELRVRKREAALAGLGHRLSAASSPVEAARIIVGVAEELLGWDACSLDLYSPEADAIEAVLTMDTIDHRRVDVSHAYPNGPPGPMTRRILADGSQLILRGTPDDPGAELTPFGDSRRSASLMFVPIRHGDRIAGVLSIQSYTPQAYDCGDLDLLETLADHCGGALERLRVEAALRESQAQLARTESFALVMTAHVSLDGRWLKVPPTLCTLLGVSEAELLRSPVSRVTHPDHVAEDEADRRRLATGEVRSSDMELRLLRRDGRPLWAYLNRSVVQDAGGRPLYLLTYLRDVTDRRTLEEQLRQAQKMEAVGQLAGGIAHDFNNLLTAIIGNGELLLREMEIEDSRRIDLLEINRAAHRAATLTRQLLAFSRKQILQPRLLNLNQVVTELGTMLRRVIGEHVELRLDLDPGLGLVLADPGQMEQVITNLAVNGRDAMPSGGCLTIRTLTLDGSHVPRTGPEEGELLGPYVALSVSDDGIGMDDRTRARLFEPFFTTKELGRGTGLGLATVYGIVRQSGGHIRVHTRVNEGSTFTVYLPRTEGPTHAEEEGPGAAEAPGGAGTVLVVEDEEAVRTLASRVLRGKGYRVLEASSADLALALLAGSTEPIDLLLTDVVMPGLSGPALAQRLILQHPALRVLYMSGYAEEAIERQGSLPAGGELLEKPFTADQLARRVRAAIAGSAS
ncbi:MAG TPA: PAS domain S-box protein [Gemmatimonadales bacterium]|nr:PAS domain S-box protein [Gemmatimonadales bacterium]